jgi:hypothetical protein
MLQIETTDGSVTLDVQQALDRYQNGTGWLSGGAVSPASVGGFAVDVTNGEVLVSGTRVTFAAATGLTLPAPDATHPRKDVIYVDGAGGVQVEPGTPAAPQPGYASRRQTYHPSPDDMTSTQGAVIATVWVPSNEASQTYTVPDDIRDRRVPIEISKTVPPDVQDDGTTVLVEAGAIDFGSNLTAVDNGDNSTTVDAAVDQATTDAILAKTRRINV